MQAYLYPTAGLGSVTPSQWYVRHLRVWEHQNTPSFLLPVSCFCSLQEALARQGNRQRNKCRHAVAATPASWEAHLAGERHRQRTSCVMECLCRVRSDTAQVPEVQDGEQLTELAAGPLSSVLDKELDGTLRPLETSER